MVLIQISGMTGMLSLCIASYFTKNFVGFAYVNSEENLIRLGHIDFWGRRKNVVIPIEDIVNLPKIFLDMWMPIQKQNDKETYKLLHRHGDILDSKTFTYVFGEF